MTKRTTTALLKHSIDWDTVFGCREFWIWYFAKSDHRVFKSGSAWHTVQSFDELMRDRSILMEFSGDFTLQIDIQDERRLVLRENGRKPVLLGWAGPHSYNHVFSFPEIEHLAKSVRDIDPRFALLLLLGYWGQADEGAKVNGKCLSAIKQAFKRTKLFTADELKVFTAPFERVYSMGCECKWLQDDRYNAICESPRTLRTTNPETHVEKKFDFRQLHRFMTETGYK